MARKQKTKRTTSRKKQAERNIVTDSKIREEIVLIITCLFSFLLFLSNLGFCGFLGEILVKIQFFFFGTFAFLFPFLLLFLLLFFMAQRENPTVYIFFWKALSERYFWGKKFLLTSTLYWMGEEFWGMESSFFCPGF